MGTWAININLSWGTILERKADGARNDERHQFQESDKAEGVEDTHKDPSIRSYFSHLL
jgi:hypothetical protein